MADQTPDPQPQYSADRPATSPPSDGTVAASSFDPKSAPPASLPPVWPPPSPSWPPPSGPEPSAGTVDPPPPPRPGTAAPSTIRGTSAPGNSAPGTSEGFDLVATLMKWVGPAFIVLGMVYGAVYLVDTNMFGPPERLAAGIVVTAGFGWLGQWFIGRGQRLLGELVTGTFFTGAFLCSWAVPAVTGWPVGTSILLSGTIGLAALGYSWLRCDSTTFSIGVLGLASIPLSGPLFSDRRFLDAVADIYTTPAMVTPLVLFTILALGLRVARGWFLPWALTNTALFISFTLMLGGSARELVAQLVAVGVLALSSLFGVAVGERRDESVVERLGRALFVLVDAAAPLLALLPVWLMTDDLGIGTTGEWVVMGLWAAVCVGLAASLYRGVPSRGIEATPGRIVGALVSAVVALLTAVGELNWYIYVVVLAAGFLASVVAGNATSPGSLAGGNDSSPASWSGVALPIIQGALGLGTAFGLTLMIVTGMDGPLADDVPTLISAWVAMVLFGIAFHQRVELRSWWGLPYGLALGLLAASISQSPVTLLITSACWLLAGFVAVRVGLGRRMRPAVMIGLATIGIAVGKLLLVDSPRFDSNLMRATAFLVAGLVVVLVSADSDEMRVVLGSKEDSKPPISTP